MMENSLSFWLDLRDNYIIQKFSRSRLQKMKAIFRQATPLAGPHQGMSRPKKSDRWVGFASTIDKMIRRRTVGPANLAGAEQSSLIRFRRDFRRGPE
jgi:hypothetical protein